MDTTKWLRKWGAILLGSVLIAGGFSSAVQAADRPVVMVVGFQNRVSKSKVTLTDFQMEPEEMLPGPRTTLEAELSLSPRIDVRTMDTDVIRARYDEATIMEQLGKGEIIPELENEADYLIYGYLTNVSNIKSQSGTIGVGGKDKTAHVELSMRVIDAHTGQVVFVTTADSRRKSELNYHAVFHRNMAGTETAVSRALDIAAQNLAYKFLQAM